MYNGQQFIIDCLRRKMKLPPGRGQDDEDRELPRLLPSQSEQDSFQEEDDDDDEEEGRHLTMEENTALRGSKTKLDVSMKISMKNNRDGTRDMLLIVLPKEPDFSGVIEVSSFPMLVDKSLMPRFMKEGDKLCVGIRFRFKENLKREKLTESIQLRARILREFGWDICPGDTLDFYVVDLAHWLKQNMMKTTSGFGPKSIDGTLRNLSSLKGCIRLFTNTLWRHLYLLNDQLGGCKCVTEITHNIRIEHGMQKNNDVPHRNIPRQNPFHSDLAGGPIAKMKDVSSVVRLLKVLGVEKTHRMSNLNWLRNIQVRVH